VEEPVRVRARSAVPIAVFLLAACAPLRAADSSWWVAGGARPVFGGDAEVRISAGWSWDERFGVELAVWDLGSEYRWYGSATSETRVKSDPEVVGVLGIARLPVGERFTLLGLAGPSFTRERRLVTERDRETGEVRSHRHDTRDDPSSVFGIGFEAAIYRGTIFRACWESVDDRDVFTAQIGWRF
jgi:hypothetical protein